MQQLARYHVRLGEGRDPHNDISLPAGEVEQAAIGQQFDDDLRMTQREFRKHRRKPCAPNHSEEDKRRKPPRILRATETKGELHVPVHNDEGAPD